MTNKIQWGSKKIIGLETDEDMEKYSIARQRAIENGTMRKYVSKEKSKQYGKQSGKSRLGRKATEEHKIKISNSLKNKPKSKEHKEKLSISKKGKKQSKEVIEKKKIIFSGQGNPMYGKNHSKKSRKKISENHGSKVLKKCPYCNKNCPANNYPRYHGDNCKFKK